MTLFRCYPDFLEYTEAINQSNGQRYTSLFIKLTGIFATRCSKSDSIMTILKLWRKLRATWILFVRIISWNSRNYFTCSVGLMLWSHKGWKSLHYLYFWGKSCLHSLNNGSCGIEQPYDPSSYSTNTATHSSCIEGRHCVNQGDNCWRIYQVGVLRCGCWQMWVIISESLCFCHNTCYNISLYVRNSKKWQDSFTYVDNWIGTLLRCIWCHSTFSFYKNINMFHYLCWWVHLLSLCDKPYKQLTRAFHWFSWS